jgi:hypothetical protein
MIISGQADAFPIQRGEVRKWSLVNNKAAFQQRADGAFKINRVPECDGGDNQI